MSMKNVIELIKAINEDPELQARAQTALDGSVDATAFVAFAKEAGYEVNDEDVTGYFTTLLSAPGPGELSDEQLNEVAGGKGPGEIRAKLDTTVSMFRGMNFTKPPSWVGFKF